MRKPVPVFTLIGFCWMIVALFICHLRISTLEDQLRETREIEREHHHNSLEIRNDLTRLRMYVGSGNPEDLNYMRKAR